MSVWNADAPWVVHPQVSVRPEPFGALLYHFGTRQLSFIKDPKLAELVLALEGAASARTALSECDEAHRDSFERALVRLAQTEMIVERAA